MTLLEGAQYVLGLSSIALILLNHVLLGVIAVNIFLLSHILASRKTAHGSLE